MTVPRSLAVTEENLALATDLYQLTMGAAYFDRGVCPVATFEMFVRTMPKNRGFLLVAGLEQAVHYLSTLRFSEEAIAFLRGHPNFAHVSDAFFDYLRQFRFTGSLHAMPEGTIAFEGEPLLRVTAPLIEAQIVETYLLATVNYQTLVATKAARITRAAQHRPIVDFGSRRAHGPQAGVLAARAAFIGGCVGTSNVLAGHELDIPIIGTMAHSFMMVFPSECDAFRAYVETFPEHATLLIDTYDTIVGARLATAFGPKMRGVRLDSGDLVTLSREVRRILDDAGLPDAKIVASGDLNEYRIADLLANEAAIDLFGVGTELVTSRDDPTLSGVYKLVEYESGDERILAVKLSEDKETYPGKKQVFRYADPEGMFQEDVIATADETFDGTALLHPVMENGEIVRELPTIREIQQRAGEQRARLNETYQVFEHPPSYPVHYSDRLRRLRHDVAAARRR